MTFQLPGCDRCHQPSTVSRQHQQHTERTIDGRQCGQHPGHQPAASARRQEHADGQSQEERVSVAGRQEQAGREDQQVPRGPRGRRPVEVQPRQEHQTCRRHEERTVGDEEGKNSQPVEAGQPGRRAGGPDQHREEREERRPAGRAVALQGYVEVARHVPASEGHEKRGNVGDVPGERRADRDVQDVDAHHANDHEQGASGHERHQDVR